MDIQYERNFKTGGLPTNTSTMSAKPSEVKEPDCTDLITLFTREDLSNRRMCCESYLSDTYKNLIV